MRRLIVLLLCSCSAARLRAAEVVLELDSAKTQITWTAARTLRAVRGTFTLARGTLSFDPDNGSASGEFVVQTASGQSGNGERDHRMVKDVLDSGKFPEATFAADRVTGKLPEKGEAKLSIHGIFTIHGEGHEMTLDTAVEKRGEQYAASTNFDIPYVQWGMKNPSDFLWKMGQTVTLEVKTVAHVPAPAK